MSVRFGGVVLDAPDPGALADFYRELLGWIEVWRDATWVQLRDPDRARPALSFQREERFVAPVWPSTRESPQMQLHLDLMVDDLAAETARALVLGATLAPVQPQDDVRVLVDPVGHVFCLFVDGA